MATSILSMEIKFGFYVTSPDPKRPSQLIKMQIVARAACVCRRTVSVHVWGLRFSWPSIMMHILLETAQLPG